MKSKELFANPPTKYHPRKIVHKLCYNPEEELSALLDQGYGGVVTNVPTSDGFTSNPDNLKLFEQALGFIRKAKLPYWIYDEHGYPSGKAAGLTLDGHPELRAKGFFMYKRMCFENTVARYTLPDEADKIVWAAKYKFGGVEERGRVDYESMVAVDFTERSVECELLDHEVLYVFSVKTLHEGTHSMHNVSSQMHNINIMDKRAVDRFIEVGYKPIAEIEGAFEGAEAVFTDEPSLFFTYGAAGYTYNYACAPYTDELFSRYEQTWGERILPNLPRIFEGGAESYSTRVKFYELCGRLVAEAYSENLREYCRSKGTVFSGHYLGEDNCHSHVQFYGNLVRVLTGTGYPGFDVLSCFPEIFKFMNQKMPEMAARKMGSGGLMVELCPFDMKSEFDKAPYDNMKCISALCYMHGARISNSYFQIQNGSADTPLMRSFNTYVGRLGYMLDGLTPSSDLFVYYPIEEIQALNVPSHSRETREVGLTTHQNLTGVIDELEYCGFNPLLCDRNDLLEAADNYKNNGKACISELPVKTLVVPKSKIIYGDAYEAICELEDSGTRVFFVDEAPSILLKTYGTASLELKHEAVDLERITERLYADGGLFVSKTDKKIIRAKFCGGNKDVYMLVNMDREDGEILFNSDCAGEILNPETGEVTTVSVGEIITVPRTRGLFVVV